MSNLKFLRVALAAVFALSFFAPTNVVAQFGRNDYVALYRLYNSQKNDHLYTTNCEEKSNAANTGYVFEGISGYVAPRQTRRTVPLHRLLLNNGEHFYTTSEQESATLSQIGGNRYENIAGYIAENPQRGTVPFYRLINGDNHFYTINEQEKNNFLQTGGRLEGIAGYLWNSGTDNCGDTSVVPGNFPVIYAQSNFQGPAQAVERDWTGNRDWEGRPHLIRSIRVPQGWYLVLYSKRNFGGQSYNLNSDWSPQSGDWWNGRIKSIKVYQGAPPRQPR